MASFPEQMPPPDEVSAALAAMLFSACVQHATGNHLHTPVPMSDALHDELKRVQRVLVRAHETLHNMCTCLVDTLPPPEQAVATGLFPNTVLALTSPPELYHNGSPVSSHPATVALFKLTRLADYCERVVAETTDVEELAVAVEAKGDDILHSYVGELLQIIVPSDQPPTTPPIDDSPPRPAPPDPVVPRKRKNAKGSSAARPLKKNRAASPVA
jgi:hypothetical protein